MPEIWSALGDYRRFFRVMLGLKNMSEKEKNDHGYSQKREGQRS